MLGLSYVLTTMNVMERASASRRPIAWRRSIALGSRMGSTAGAAIALGAPFGFEARVGCLDRSGCR